MKNTFPSFYNDPDYDELWENCIFVFDTNVLLDLYSYSEETTDDFLDRLDDAKIRDRIWLPYHVALEYHFNRSSIISDQEKIYETISNAIKKDGDKLKKSFKGLKQSYQTDHRHLDLNDIYSRYDEIIDEFNSKIDAMITEINDQKGIDPKLSDNDIIKDRITDLFDGKVGENYDPFKLGKIFELGESRYFQKIPPGYSFRNDKNKFGDLIIWFQMMDHAKTESKPIIFVNNQKDEEWWHKDNHNAIIGPRPELIQEFVNETKQDFHMYRMPQFVKYLEDYQNIEFKEETIAEIDSFVSETDRTTELLEKLEEMSTSSIPSSSLERLSNMINASGMSNARLVHDSLYPSGVSTLALQRISDAINVAGMSNARLVHDSLYPSGVSTLALQRISDAINVAGMSNNFPSKNQKKKKDPENPEEK